MMLILVLVLVPLLLPTHSVMETKLISLSVPLGSSLQFIITLKMLE